MTRRRWRRPPGGYTTAAGSGGRRAPFSTDTDSHTHTARSLACPLLTLSSSARPFSNGIFRSDDAPASLPPASSSLTHTPRMDSFRNQNADQLGSLAGLSPIFSRCICRCSRMLARLPPPRVLLPHTYTQDGWFLQRKRRPARLPRRTIFSRRICRCSRACTRLPPPTHTPPHTGFPMSAHLSRLRLFQRHLRILFWVWVWVWNWVHTPPSILTRSSSSRHPPFTQYPFPSRSLVRDGQTSPHMPRLVVPHSTCPSLSPSRPRTQLYNRSCSNKHTLLSHEMD
jgi:hypothetical protein